MENIREEKFADLFYPKDPETLRDQIKIYSSLSSPVNQTGTISTLANKNNQPEEAIITLLPHAGYIYSAHVALAALKRVQLKKKLVILCPNHTGLGTNLAVWDQGAWQTPLGNVPIDEELAKQILNKPDLYTSSPEAHYHEHSIEVLLPLLIDYFQAQNFSIVPICVRESKLDQAADHLAQIYKERSGDFDIIISSDLNHYANQETTIQKDYIALNALLTLDTKTFIDAINTNSISMCGSHSTALALTFLKHLNKKYKAHLALHDTSAKTNNDYQKVVGYASLYVVNES